MWHNGTVNEMLIWKYSVGSGREEKILVWQSMCLRERKKVRLFCWSVTSFPKQWHLFFFPLVSLWLRWHVHLPLPLCFPPRIANFCWHQQRNIFFHPLTILATGPSLSSKPSVWIFTPLQLIVDRCTRLQIKQLRVQAKWWFQLIWLTPGTSWLVD